MSQNVQASAQFQRSQNFLDQKAPHRDFTSRYIHIVGSEDLDFNCVIAKLTIFAFPIIASLTLLLDFLSSCCQNSVAAPLSENLLYGQRLVLIQQVPSSPARERRIPSLSNHIQLDHFQPQMAPAPSPSSEALSSPAALSLRASEAPPGNLPNTQKQARSIPANIAVRTPQPTLVLNQTEDGTQSVATYESKEQEEQDDAVSPKDLAADFQTVSHAHATPDDLRTSPHTLQTSRYAGILSPLNYVHSLWSPGNNQ